MAVNEQLLNRVRKLMAHHDNVLEKAMFGGICFMVDDKLCVCVRKNSLLCRLDPESYTDELEKNGVTAMVHNGRLMKGYVYVDENELDRHAKLIYWINAALAYNVHARPAKNKTRKA